MDIKKERIYDIEARCYEFAKQVVLFLGSIDNRSVFRPLFTQLLRSATSIGANVIEGRSGNSRRHMVSYYSISLRSANETKYWFRLIKDTMQVDNSRIQTLLREVCEIANILGKWIIKLKQAVPQEQRRISGNF